MQIPVHEYLAHALTFTDAETVLRARVLAVLPPNIIDAHLHCNQAEHVVGISPYTLGHMMSTFPSFTIEETQEMQRLFFGEKDVRTLRFAHAFRGIDHRGANAYLLARSPARDRVALYGIPDDVPYTVLMLRSGSFAALKMYPRYFEPVATTVYGYFRPEILEEAQELDIPIILHLPRVITACAEDLAQCVADFPRLRIVLAHLGLPHIPVPGLAEVYARFASVERISMDTAMIPSAEVVTMALRYFGAGRIFYGSDAPLNMLRSVVYHHPTQGERIVTSYPYHWSDPDEYRIYGHLAEGAVHAHWQCIMAIITAVHQMDTTEEGQRRLLQLIFHDNAAAYFGF